MASLVKIKNRSNGVASVMPLDIWQQIKDTRQWSGVFYLVRVINEPPEVEALRQRLKK